ncbi:MAG: NAD(P)H-dependent oxidoreductase [Candidatus Babeliales bacterium]|nr:NAD(P)H-dependent oxidoreductase [Candidatus Babeliales bacterium]
MLKTNVFILIILITIPSCFAKDSKMEDAKKPIIQIILGSTRQGRTSEKVYNALKGLIDKRTDVVLEKIDLKDFNLPFLDDAVSPSSRKEITDPIIQKWSDKIKQADAYIILVPEYNSGYPGVLKNALDLLYKEWNNKPVAFIGFSGGPDGAANAIAQLRQVARAFKMTPVEAEIKIPTSWKAFDEQGNLINNVEADFNKIIDQLKR